MKPTKERPAMMELNMAWEEYFKDKPEPKNDEAKKKELEGFHHWYNYIRKQSDTGKTPAEMYKKAYGKEPPEASKKMDFELDEDFYDEAAREAEEIFEEEIWKEVKGEMKELTRKEACKSMFSLGFLAYMKLMDEQLQDTLEHKEKE